MFDYQKVNLKAITQPVEYITKTVTAVQFDGSEIEMEMTRRMTPDEFIVYCARVSNPSNQNNTETADKLIRYLIRNEHWSPFEMVHITMEIKTTRDIGRQILRHRSFSFQEFSQRYADASQVGFTTRELRFQDPKNRQNSITISEEDKRDMSISIIREEWESRQRNIQEMVTETYEWALFNNIAKEQARAVLPEAMTMSTMYMSGTLRSWLHYCKLRCANGTQKEHMDIAMKARDILIENFPSCKEYLLDDKA